MTGLVGPLTFISDYSLYRSLKKSPFQRASIIVDSLSPVRFYGEFKFYFASIKVAGVILDLGGVPGQERLGFRYWKYPYPLHIHWIWMIFLSILICHEASGIRIRGFPSSDHRRCRDTPSAKIDTRCVEGDILQSCDVL
ncbi:hypothetical protein BDQ12DRAFT_673154 [Crucibulum laeve]|uniref:Uncharacterized protein n=1 Tax=Crucibulum laeve TaxID=68775 RepID=A0A5C3MH25_9AGAR|nr:hypothetical protein BDQ12DRAFT_673154 [Crucibulum laeve]